MKTDNPTNIVQWLLKEKGWTQLQLANELGIQQGKVSQMANRPGRRIDIEMLCSLWRLSELSGDEWMEILKELYKEN